MVSNILIADDHELFRETLINALKTYFPNSNFDQAGSGKEVLDVVESSIPDIIILDIDMPEVNGLHTLKLLKQQEISSKVLILTAKKAKEFIYIAKQYKANGFLTKNISVETLAEVIQRITSSNLFVCSEWFSLDFNTKDEFSKNVLTRLPLLTNRERQVLAFFFGGLNTSEVAAAMNIRKKSVDNYKNRILSKLQVSEEIYFLDWIIKNQEVLRYVI